MHKGTVQRASKPNPQPCTSGVQTQPSALTTFFNRAGEMAQCLTHRAFSQSPRNDCQHPHGVCNCHSSSIRSDSLLWTSLGKPMVHRHTWKQKSHTHKRYSKGAYWKCSPLNHSQTLLEAQQFTSALGRFWQGP